MAGKKNVPQQRIAKGGDRKRANFDTYPGIKSSSPSNKSAVTTTRKGGTMSRAKARKGVTG